MKRDENRAVLNTIAGDFQLETITHERFYLNQNRGKVVVLIFWATWCNSCKYELQQIQRQKILTNPDISIVSICTDPENKDDLTTIVGQLSQNITVLLDYHAKLYRQYKLRAYPTTLVIDPEGIIRMIQLGGSDLDVRKIATKAETLFIKQRNKKG